MVTGPVIRWVTQDASLPECEASLSLPVLPLSLHVSFAFDDGVAVGFIFRPACTAPRAYPWCCAEGESLSRPWLCGLVSHTDRWQAGVEGRLATDPVTLPIGPLQWRLFACYLEIPQCFPVLPWKVQALFLFVVQSGFQLGLQMNFSDMLPFRFNPMDD